MNENFGKVSNVMKRLCQVREQLGMDERSKNWQTLEGICREKVMCTNILIKTETYSADWRKLVARLIQEINCRNSKGCSNLHQCLIQNGKTSMLKCIDISKEALILFGDGAEEVFLYQPDKKRVISEEMQNSLTELLKERGISAGAAIKKCSLDQGNLIGRLSQELQAIQEKQESQDKIGLFYSVIQDGKTLELKDFDKTKQAVFLVGNRYEVEIYLI